MGNTYLTRGATPARDNSRPNLTPPQILPLDFVFYLIPVPGSLFPIFRLWPEMQSRLAFPHDLQHRMPPRRCRRRGVLPQLGCMSPLARKAAWPPRHPQPWTNCSVSAATERLGATAGSLLPWWAPGVLGTGPLQSADEFPLEAAPGAGGGQAAERTGRGASLPRRGRGTFPTGLRDCPSTGRVISLWLHVHEARGQRERTRSSSGSRCCAVTGAPASDPQATRLLRGLVRGDPATGDVPVLAESFLSRPVLESAAEMGPSVKKWLFCHSRLQHASVWRTERLKR